MTKCMHVVCKWLCKNTKSLPRVSRRSLSLAVGHRWCMFQSELIHTAGLWISSRYLACQIFHRCRRFPQIASLIIDTAWFSLAWTSNDFPPISCICLRFIKTCRRMKNRTCEFGISLWQQWLQTWFEPCDSASLYLLTNDQVNKAVSISVDLRQINEHLYYVLAFIKITKPLSNETLTYKKLFFHLGL